MTLRLTPREYRALLRMAWIARRTIALSAQESQNIDDMVRLGESIQAQAETFGAADILPQTPAVSALPGSTLEESLGFVAPNGGEDPLMALPALPGLLREEVEIELSDICGWQDEYQFWDRLEQMLSFRDITERFTMEEWDWLPDSGKEENYNEILDSYTTEFSTNGIARLRINTEDRPESDSPQFKTFSPPPGSGRRSEGKIISFPHHSPKGKPK